MIRIIYILVFAVFLFQPLFSQTDKGKRELYKESREAFDKEEYKQALGLLLQYDSLYPNDFEIIYRIGACYLNSEFDKIKAIPYLERSIENKKKTIPASTFRDLGHVYQLDYQLDKSKEMYQHYLDMKPELSEEIEHIFSSIENAKLLIQDSLPLKIENIGPAINTSLSEVMPFVSADESILYYQNKESHDFFLAYNKYDSWQEKIKINIPNLDNYDIVKFAGISPDGGQIFVQIGDSNNTDIYYGQNFLRTCDQLIPFNSNINTSYHEGSVSIAPDGNSLYFSSNRPGGYGGYDIYRCLKDTGNQWGVAENLGPVVNTKYDELYPFIHPSMTKLFFSSKGHKTMGGYDIFEVSYIDDTWQAVENIGYPINTTYDDMSYSMTAKGNAAYLSSTRSDKTNHFDIYKVYLKESIPLTLVKGKILAGDPPKAIDANIQVIDKETGLPLKYIYNPNPKTGYYLLIFPPGKDYDMIIKAEGYSPYVINIYIPNQSYFYENFQEIQLSPIQVKTLGQTIGEEIKVKNTFYDIYENLDDSSRVQKIAQYDKLLALIETLIVKTDTLGLNKINEYVEPISETNQDVEKIDEQKDYDQLFSLVEKALESTDSTALKILDENAIPNYSYQNRHFYNEGGTDKSLESVVIASDTIRAIKLTSQKAVVTKIEEPEEDIAAKDSKPVVIKDITECSIYFDKNESSIDKKYNERLLEITQLVSNNSNLYLEINGRANPDEKSQLAVSRAIELRSFFTNNSLDIERTKTKATLNKTKAKDKGQRVDIKVFESKKPLYKKGEFIAAVRLGEKEKTVANNNKETGVIYKVQIASGANLLKENSSFFKGEKATYYIHKTMYKYVVGSFASSKEAYREQLRLEAKAFKGAFVVKFKDGVRVD